MDLVQNRRKLLYALYDVYIEGGNQSYPLSLIAEKLDLSDVQLQTAARELEEDHLVKGMRVRVPGPVEFIAITAEGRRHVEDMRSAPGPPQLVHVVLAGFTAEGRQEFLYFVDTGKGRPGGGISAKHACMIKMTLDGEEVLRIGYPKEAPGYQPDGSTKFSPTNVAIAPNGDIYVADGYGAYFINQYDARGKFIRSFGGNGKNAGQLACPHGLIVDTRGAEPYLLVADRTNNRLQRFTLDGRHLGFGAGVNLPCHFHARKGVAVVPDLAARLTLLDRDNRVITHLGEDTAGDWQQLRSKPRNEFRPGKFVSPHGACFDHAGNIFVAEWVEVGRVTKLRRV